MKGTSLKPILNIVADIIFFYLGGILISFIVLSSALPLIVNTAGLAFIYAVLFCLIKNFKSLSLKEKNFIFEKKDIVLILVCLLLSTNLGLANLKYLDFILPDNVVVSIRDKGYIFLSIDTFFQTAYIALWYIIIKKMFFRKVKGK